MMLGDDVALVLGAGSSFKFGLPLGSTLKEKIAKVVDIYFDDWGNKQERGSRHIVEALRQHAHKNGHNDINPYIRAGRNIAQALPNCDSIDEYIERHSSDKIGELCAKLGIVQCILEGEKGSKFAKSREGRTVYSIGGLGDSWISSYLRRATHRCAPDNLEEAFTKIKVINFNYDRCFEIFALLWLQDVYHLDEQTAANCVSKAQIVHPYGTLGGLPFQSTPQSEPFGADVGTGRLLQIAPRIRTYSESFSDHEISSQIKAIVQTSKKLFFLGFAFHRPNVELLKVGQNEHSTIRIYTTDVGMPEARWPRIQESLADAFGILPVNMAINRVPDSCEKLLFEFGDYLFA